MRLGCVENKVLSQSLAFTRAYNRFEDFSDQKFKCYVLNTFLGAIREYGSTLYVGMPRVKNGQKWPIKKL